MRVPAGKLLSHSINNILQREQVCVSCHMRMENNLHQNIAKFFFHTFKIVIINSF